MRFLSTAILLFFLTAIPIWARGEDVVTYLDWQKLRVDSVLPVYTEVVPLETDYRLYDYSVRVDYPEFAPLTASEKVIAHQHRNEIRDSLIVESHVGVLRRQGMLDISFVPIVFRDGKYQKVLSCRITIIPHEKPLSRKALAKESKSRYVAHSVLATGKWVKIKIVDDGIYSLTRSSLKKMGFKNPENVHLYGYGGHLQDEYIQADNDYDDLCEVPMFHEPNSNVWLFWGNGLLHWNGNQRIRNHYARYACYFLTEEEEPSQIETLPSLPEEAQKVYTSFEDHILYEQDQFAWHSVGCNLYDGANYASSNVRTYKLQTLNSVGDELLTVAFTAGAKSATTLQTSVNGTALQNMQLAALSSYTYATTATRTFDVSKMRPEDNSWNVRLNSTAGNDAHLDYLALHYSRKLALHNGFVAFSKEGQGLSEFQITCVPGNTKVMRVGTSNYKCAMLSSEAKDEVTLSVKVEDPQLHYVAFDVTYNFPEPTVIGEIHNQDLHAMDSLDMVILVPASGKLLPQAQRLADAHAQYDGLRVGVVRADEVYNEFSSGTPDATAYRRFMKMLYDRAEDIETAPRYLLLMGDGAWDNRMLSTAWQTRTPDDYLLCFESDNSYSDTKSYVMEDYFGLLDDGEGRDLMKDKTDLGIGRFPVTAVSEAKIMVDKAIAYMSNSNAGSWKNVVCFMGDDGDNNEHMQFADDVAERVGKQCPEMEIRKVMWDAYVRVSTNKNNTYPEVVSLLKKQSEEGAMVMNYTGHATTYTLSHEFVLNVEDFAAFKGTHLPLWVTAACDVMPFDGQSNNIGETAVLNPQGGALAFYGTTRTVYANQNLSMNRYFMQYLFSSDKLGRRYRLGDAIRLAKNAIIQDGLEFSQVENKLQYCLLGDPALTIGAPLQHVLLDSINGQPVEKEKPIMLKAGSMVRFEGHVVGADGSSLDDFIGTISARVYDSETTITCNNNAGARSPFSFANRSNVLYVAQDSISSGHFSLSFTVPVDINYSDASGRVVFYAIDRDKTTEANGYSEAFTLGGVSDELDGDREGPKIYAFLNTDTFQDGDKVNCSPMFAAQLVDESGVNASGNGIGHDLSLCIDGRADYTYTLNDYYVSEFGDFTRGMVAFPIPATLDAGPHTLEFRAWDVLNNTSTSTLSFVVDPELRPQMFQLSASQNPAVSHTNFLVSYDRPGAECTFTIDVYDFLGRRVWSHTETGSSAGTYSIPWNLTNGVGGRIESGVYLYRCTLQCGDSREVSKTQKIIVLNNK